jgi:hypothetical protein
MSFERRRESALTYRVTNDFDADVRACTKSASVRLDDFRGGARRARARTTSPFSRRASGSRIVLADSRARARILEGDEGCHYV